ncbi:MAG TPA: transporter substrate-binding domain-containing protein [Stellaceae bacterium]|nr:transporter substrate-binding domain-containing protein [Stellaceae bacterium]
MDQRADPRVADLVQAGAIRTALFLPQYVKDPASGALQGRGTGAAAAAITHILAARLGIVAQMVGYPTPSSVVACLKTGACDVAFMGIEPSRAAELDFSPAIFQFDYTYLVPAGSAIHTAADADRPGLRVAVVSGHASTLALSLIVKHAELVGSELPDAAFEVLRAERADAFAGPRDVIVDYAVKLPGARVLADAYGVNRVGIALRKGQPGRLAYIGEFVEEAKASGLIQRAIESGGLRGFRVAPRDNASPP